GSPQTTQPQRLPGKSRRITALDDADIRPGAAAAARQRRHRRDDARAARPRRAVGNRDDARADAIRGDRRDAPALRPAHADATGGHPRRSRRAVGHHARQPDRRGRATRRRAGACGARDRRFDGGQPRRHPSPAGSGRGPDADAGERGGEPTGDADTDAKPRPFQRGGRCGDPPAKSRGPRWRCRRADPDAVSPPRRQRLIQHSADPDAVSPPRRQRLIQHSADPDPDAGRPDIDADASAPDPDARPARSDLARSRLEDLQLRSHLHAGYRAGPADRRASLGDDLAHLHHRRCEHPESGAGDDRRGGTGRRRLQGHDPRHAADQQHPRDDQLHRAGRHLGIGRGAVPADAHRPHAWTSESRHGDASARHHAGCLADASVHHHPGPVAQTQRDGDAPGGFAHPRPEPTDRSGGDRRRAGVADRCGDHAGERRCGPGDAPHDGPGLGHLPPAAPWQPDPARPDDSGQARPRRCRARGLPPLADEPRAARGDGARTQCRLERGRGRRRLSGSRSDGPAGSARQHRLHRQRGRGASGDRLGSRHRWQDELPSPALRLRGDRHPRQPAQGTAGVGAVPSLHRRDSPL
ncbi:MAG: hypothetical protein AVDCRST_MAG18-2563, partial [uncultured Thermomicrobiales bacterium]